MSVATRAKCLERCAGARIHLVGNAFEHHHEPARARVVVRFEEVAESWRFIVEDDGPGIESADHERIFELFETLDSSRDADSTGVGLSNVKKVVEEIGGSVSIDSPPGEGTVFTVDWPKRFEALERFGSANAGEAIVHDGEGRDAAARELAPGSVAYPDSSAARR